MENKRFFKLKYLAVLLQVSLSYSQVADFTANVTEGCTPLDVKFTNTGSTGANYSYDWDFGDMSFSDTENPPLKTYSNPNSSTLDGEYYVTLTVTDKNTLQSSYITKPIFVKRTPSPSLEIDSSNSCVNGDIIFETGYDPKTSVIWNFGDGTYGYDYISQIVTHAYKANGKYNMSFITFLDECSDTQNYVINVKGPNASFTMSKDRACIKDTIAFTMDNSPVDVTSYFWDLNGNTYTNTNPVFKAYDNSGYFVARLNLTGPAGSCIIDDTVNIIKLIAQFTFTEERFCDGQLISMQSKSVGNDYNYWDFGNGHTATGTNTSESFSIGNHSIKLKVSNDIGCSDSILKEIIVSKLPSLQISNDTTICLEKPIQLRAISDADKISWVPAKGLNSANIFEPVALLDTTITYYITVTDTNTKCRQFGQLNIEVTDQIIHDTVTVYPYDTTICSGRSLILNAIGKGHEIAWNPSTYLNNPSIFNPTTNPNSTIKYYITVTDTSTGCRQYGQSLIHVLDQTQTENISVLPLEDTIFIGDMLQLNAIDLDSLNRKLNYKWSPADQIITCSNCMNPVVQPLITTTYLLDVTDSITCYSPVHFEIPITVIEKYIIGVPDAFTPNGDDINPTIKVNGKGIKNFIEFRIYNRWGTEVFYTNDINIGWDGNYKGKPQNMDSYAYVIKAEMWDNNVITKTGSFSLIR